MLVPKGDTGVTDIVITSAQVECAVQAMLSKKSICFVSAGHVTSRK